MKIIKKLILSVDAGNYEGKVVGPYGVLSFKTNIAEDVELKADEKFGDDDMRYEIDGLVGLAGTIAKYEAIGDSTIQGDSKAHEFTKIRVLLAIFRYIKHYKLDVEKVSVMVGQPFKKHVNTEKDKIKEMLENVHPIVVNDEPMTITIDEVGVAPEGVSGYYASQQQYSNCCLLDIGSGTVNAIAISDYHIISNRSDTFNYGTESKDMTLEKVARNSIKDSTNRRWDKQSKVLVCGGSAGAITELIQKEYPNAEILLPSYIMDNGKTQILEPKYANAVGMYIIALRKWK
jgi:plasmid segregation protein ParM